MNIGDCLKFGRAMNGVAAGTTVQTGSTIDCQGYDGCIFVLAVGTLSATQVTALKVAEGAASDGSDKADLAASKQTYGDANSNTLLVVDVNKPLKRYLTPIVNRATANAVIDGVFFILYRGIKQPSVDDATVLAKLLMTTPAEGTA